MDGFEWREPPSDIRYDADTKQGRAAIFADMLKTNPGKWAFYGRVHRTQATYLKKQYGLDAICRDTRDGQADVYARWNEEPHV